MKRVLCVMTFSAVAFLGLAACGKQDSTSAAKPPARIQPAPGPASAPTAAPAATPGTAPSPPGSDAAKGTVQTQSEPAKADAPKAESDKDAKK